jgi:hypothetical protein
MPRSFIKKGAEKCQSACSVTGDKKTKRELYRANLCRIASPSVGLAVVIRCRLSGVLD